MESQAYFRFSLSIVLQSVTKLGLLSSTVIFETR